MLFRRTATILLLLTFLITTGLGCKGLSAEEKAAIRPVKLQYWTVYNNVEELEKVAAEYHAIRSYVTVDIRRVRYEEFEDLLVNALADDVAPDIVSIQNTALRQYQPRLSSMPGSVNVSTIEVKGKYAPETVVTPVTETMPTPTIIERAFVSAVPGDVIIGDAVYGLPLSLDTLALYYNKDLLDKAGVPVAPVTWDEFFEAVKKSTKLDAEGQKLVQSGVALGTANNIDNAFPILSLLMLQNNVPMNQGSQVTFAEGLQGRGAANHPTLQALRFYTDFARPDKEIYSWNKDQPNAFEAFVRGQSVFYFGFAFDRARILSRAPQMNVEIIPIPQLSPDQPVNVASYWVETVLKKSKHQNEAWDFVRFISTPNNIKRYTDATETPSPLREHIAAQAARPSLMPFTANILTAKNWYKGKNVQATRAAFLDMITAYLEPYPENQTPFERDANLVIRAARTVQQTM